MSVRKDMPKLGVGICFCFAVVALLAGSAFGQGMQLSPEDSDKQISVTVWLNLHNKSALDALVRDLYDKNSPNFHHWLTMARYKAQFAPTAMEVAAVRDFLAAHNMKVTSVDEDNLYVTAEVLVGDAQKAFNAQINRVMINGEVHRLNATEASVKEPAGTLISVVQGLNDLGYQAHVRPAINPATGAPSNLAPLPATGTDGLFDSANCLSTPQSVSDEQANFTVTFTTKGTFPEATYSGNKYVSNCGYDAAELEQAYGLNRLYSRGLDGTGQTVMIVDAFGSNTIFGDANVFSQLNGLPLLTTIGPSPNFKILTPTGVARCTATNGCIAGNWQFETTLDVEWAHSIAPGAKIVLVVAESNSFKDLDAANLFAIRHGHGNRGANVLSNSFGIPEIALVDLLPSELVVENQISELAAALGISQQVSTGDSGDNLALDNAAFGINSVSAGANADSPFVTAVGGTSTFLDANRNIKLQTGWGLNFVRIANPNPNPPTIPPLFFGFQSGAGGGASVVYAKPSFQAALSGNFRQTPDISMNADPQTGVEIIVTPDSVPGHQLAVGVFGGTSLSCPMFSAMWAIANQAAGGGPLGQAAPLLYDLPSDAITDVDVNQSTAATAFNVTGVISTSSTSSTSESAAFLAQPGSEGCTTALVNGKEVPIACPPAQNTNVFLSALFKSPASTRWDVFTFGTDSSLATGPGWDNVTGLGTPNGENFIGAVLQALNDR
jgi:subtilase family serine protease